MRQPTDQDRRPVLSWRAMIAKRPTWGMSVDGTWIVPPSCGRTRQWRTLLGQVALEAYKAVWAHRNLPINNVDGGVGPLTAAGARLGRLAVEVEFAAHDLSLVRTGAHGKAKS